MEEDGIDGENRRCSTVTSFLCGRAGLLVLVSSYAVLGAVIFETLESGNEGNPPGHIQRSREDCLRELWQITERLNVLYEKNWTRLVTEELKKFERAIIETPRNDNFLNISAPNWTFGGALLYSLTLLTTVGYVRLSPRTTLGKVVAIVYAIIGVPLMLILLSALGSLMAGGARKCYIKLCCKQRNSKDFQYNVEYHRTPSSPARRNCRQSINNDDSSLIQLMPTRYQNNVHRHYHKVIEELPKKAVLATVRSSHTRGRCASNQVRQMLAEPQACLPHVHGTSSRIVHGCAVTLSDVEETDDNDENDAPTCIHDTPSRVPLIWKSSNEFGRSPSPTPPSETIQPTVPATLVLLIFITYVCIGAIIFATTNGWSFLDAIYFCFIALSTIGISDKLPQSADYNAQLQLLVCCLYLFIGLVIVAMCFSLVHDEIASKCKQFAITMGLIKN